MEIDVGSLRQHFREDGDGEPTDNFKDDWHDKVRWIEASIMLADPFPTLTRPTRLIESLSTGVLDVTPAPKSLQPKLMKQKNRQKNKMDAEDVNEVRSNHSI